MPCLPNHISASSRRELQCELDVMQDLLRGLTDGEIADHLGLSPDTVQDHVFRIFDKLGLEELQALGAAEWSDDLEDADTAGFAVKKPKEPRLEQRLRRCELGRRVRG